VFWAELTDKFVQKRGVDLLTQDKTRPGNGCSRVC
jgi:hypothetical protein